MKNCEKFAIMAQVYFDMEVGGKSVGRIVFQLYGTGFYRYFVKRRAANIQYEKKIGFSVASGTNFKKFYF